MKNVNLKQLLFFLSFFFLKNKHGQWMVGKFKKVSGPNYIDFFCNKKVLIGIGEWEQRRGASAYIGPYGPEQAPLTAHYRRPLLLSFLKCYRPSLLFCVSHSTLDTFLKRYIFFSTIMLSLSKITRTKKKKKKKKKKNYIYKYYKKLF